MNKLKLNKLQKLPVKQILTFVLLFANFICWSQEEDRQRRLEEQKARLQEEIRQKELQLGMQRKKEKDVSKIVANQKEKIGLQLQINSHYRKAKKGIGKQYVYQSS